jgi:hypothetical protein
MNSTLAGCGAFGNGCKPSSKINSFSITVEPCKRINPRFGTATDAYMPIGVHADFVNNILGRQVQLMQDNNLALIVLGDLKYY